MPGIKLVSLNIERSAHLPLVEAFFAREEPDVICLQELIGEDVPRLQSALPGYEVYFEPMGIRPDEAPSLTMGLGIFSRLPMRRLGPIFYVGSKDDPLLASKSEKAETYNNFRRFVLAADIESDGVLYRVATTHFTWTPNGQATDEQRTDLREMLRVLDELGQFVLVGDFNAPRGLPGQGGEIFSALAERYKDNVPPEYKTSLDPLFHRARLTNPRDLDDKMVDGFFTTKDYRAKNVYMQGGVSDHFALIGEVEKTA